ncbi:MAG: tonB-system energizer ExbB [Beijerinckiaceae bacterium]
MFVAADVIVKAVMIGLAFASVVTWTIFLAKWTEITLAKARLRRTGAVLSRQPSLSAAVDSLPRKFRLGKALTTAAHDEIVASELAFDKDGIKERVRSRLGRLEAHATRSIATGTGILATIGSTAPFVGLFGTVWGIMNSFIGISKAQTTNLAIVAPGIAEALLATAIGLVAAIPAVIVYNFFTRSIAGYRALVTDLTEETMRLVSRDLDRSSIRAARMPEASHGR